MKQIYILVVLLCSFTQLSAQYYWQVTEIASVTNGETYNFNDTPEDIIITINQCAGGIKKPHNSTSFTLTWYVNSTNSNTEGTVVNSTTKNTIDSYTSTIPFTPPTNIAGTFYYYAEFSNPSRSQCGFTTTLTSPTVEVIVIPEVVLNIDEVEVQRSNIRLYPNPTKDFVSITNLPNPTSYSLYNNRISHLLPERIYSAF